MSFDKYANYQKYLDQNILAIDFGLKVTGLATFTPGKVPFPCPYDRIIFKSDQQLAEQIESISLNEQIDLIILGMPRFSDGTDSEMTKRVLKFKKILEEKIQSIPVLEQDETLSTFEAKERMKSSPRYNFKVDLKQIDSLAASIILEDFIKG